MSDYVTLDEFKAAKELVGFSFADYDAQRAITSACRGIDEYTGRFFYTSSGTQQMLYEWQGARRVETGDLVTVATVDVDYDRDGTYETVWSQGTHFLLEPYNAAFTSKPYEELGLLPTAVYHRPTWYPALVRVTGEFGWPAVPEPVKQATTIIAARLLRRSRDAPFGIVGVGGENPMRISRFDSDISFLLDPYVKGAGVMAA